MADEPEQNPLDQLIDLFVYAPVGLLYEYQEVIPKLVRRGKSQVQIAKVIGQLAVNRGGSEAFTQLAGGVASILARQITEIGASIGLAPPPPERAPAPPPSERAPAPPPPQPPPPAPQLPAKAREGPPPPTTEPEAAAGEQVTGEADAGEAATDHLDQDRPLPIAGYDELKAKEIIALLEELDPGQLDRIRAHEEANRTRKTVLGKLDRLAR